MLVPLNIGGCGGSNVDLSNLTNGLNGIHTGNSVVDTIGVGNAASAGAQTVQTLTFDDQQEADLGRNVALQITTRYGVVDSNQIERYVTLVGLTVADASPRNDFPYCFAVLNSNKVNAYSGPDGFVMITRGALAQMRDESELAGVLGHEIGHINKHHGAQAVKGAQAKGVLSTLTKNVSYVNLFGSASDYAFDVIGNVGFTEPQELEADAEGVRYAAAAGYNPSGYLHFLQRMAAVQTGQGAPFSTHPGLADRATRVADQINREGLGGKGRTLQARFLENVRLSGSLNQ